MLSITSNCCCIILEKGDLFWSNTFVEVLRSWHFISRHVRFACYYLLATLPLRAGAPGSIIRSGPRQALRAVQSVGRAAWCATFVSGGLRSRPSCPRPAHGPECKRDSRLLRGRELQDRDGAMAVSQPRPPDRVDAALEKVAPLRYLEAHEYARERVLTRYYRHYLSYNSFLSFKRLFRHAIEEFDVISDNTIRYV